MRAPALTDAEKERLDSWGQAMWEAISDRMELLARKKLDGGT